MTAAPSGSTCAGPLMGSAPRRSSKRTYPDPVVVDVADHHDLLQAVQPVAHRRQVGQVVALADARHDDQRPGPALAEDEADLLGAVEVHDRHQRHAEHGAGVEGDGRLDPVGQLEGDDVARTEPEGAQPAGHAQRLLVDLADGPEVGVGGRPDAEAARRIVEEAVAQELPERAVVPGALGQVPLGQRGRHRAQIPGRHADSMNSVASRWRCGPAPPDRSSFCFTRLKRKWASLAHVKPTPPCSWMSSPVTRTPASAA